MVCCTLYALPKALTLKATVEGGPGCVCASVFFCALNVSRQSADMAEKHLCPAYPVLVDKQAEPSKPRKKFVELFNSTPLWAVISILIGIVVAYYSYQLTAQNKSLSYSSTYKSLLVSPGSESIKITYLNQPVENIYLMDIKIINDGNQVIEPENFKKDLSISISDCRILGKGVIESNPSQILTDFKKSLYQDGNILKIRPSLMNPGDYLTIRVVAGDCRDISAVLTGRISGISEISQTKERSTSADIRIIYFLLAFIVLFLIFVILQPRKELIILKQLNGLKKDLENLEVSDYHDTAETNIEDTKKLIEGKKLKLKILKKGRPLPYKILGYVCSALLASTLYLMINDLVRG